MIHILPWLKENRHQLKPIFESRAFDQGTISLRLDEALLKAVERGAPESFAWACVHHAIMRRHVRGAMSIEENLLSFDEFLEANKVEVGEELDSYLNAARESLARKPLLTPRELLCHLPFDQWEGERFKSASYTLKALGPALGVAATNLYYARYPEVSIRQDTRGRAACLLDARYHLEGLEGAVSFDSPTLFVDYLQWAKILLHSLSIPVEHLVHFLRGLSEIIEFAFPKVHRETILKILNGGLDQFASLELECEPALEESNELGVEAKIYLDSLLRGERQKATDQILELAEAGVGVGDIYLHIFSRSQQEIGRLWQTSQISVAKEHFCTALTQAIMARLWSYMIREESEGKRMIVTCITGDQHELGGRMLADFFEMAGWDTYFFGANTPISGILESAKEHKADVLSISVTMPHLLDNVRELISLVRQDADLSELKILVGGYPFRAESKLWKAVGADGSAETARDAVKVVNEIVSGSQ